MFAVLPGAPKISYFTTLGLNWTILIPAPALAFKSCEPKTLCRRVTTSPDTDKTTSSNTGIHQRLRIPPIELALTRPPPARPVAIFSANAVGRRSIPSAVGVLKHYAEKAGRCAFIVTDT